VIHLKRTNSENYDFINLVRQLDDELTIRDGSLHSFYDQYNKITGLKFAVVAYLADEAVGCGAIKIYTPGVMEVKRMFVPEAHRGKGIASKILAELEKWCLDLGNNKLILETGKGQPEAVNFYKNRHYKLIPNFGQYAGVENSLCFEKQLFRQ